VLPRREFHCLSAATGCAALALAGTVSTVAQAAPVSPDATNGNAAANAAMSNARMASVLSQSAPDTNTAGILVETLIASGVPFVFGIVVGFERAGQWHLILASW
jgi:hypothetical protein